MKATESKNNENNNTSNILMNKTLKSLNDTLGGGKTHEGSNVSSRNNTFKMVSNKISHSSAASKRSSMMSTISAVTTSTMDPHYMEEEDDIDNFNDLDFDDFKSKLDTFNANKSNEKADSFSNLENTPFGTFEDLHSGSNSVDFSKIKTSHSLKNISSIMRDDSYNSKEKEIKRMKHNTINLSDFSYASLSQGKSKSSNILQATATNSKNSSNNSIANIDKQTNKNSLHFRTLRKKYPVPNSTGTLDSFDGADNELLTELYMKNNVFNKGKNHSLNKYAPIKFNPHSKNSSNNSSKSDTRRFVTSDNPFDDEFSIPDSNSSNGHINVGSIRGKHGLGDSNPFAGIFDRDPSGKDGGNNKGGGDRISSASQNIFGSNSIGFYNSNKIHNLNKKHGNSVNKPIEVYGDEDFDFGGMENQELKIDEKLLLNGHGLFPASLDNDNSFPNNFNNMSNDNINTNININSNSNSKSNSFKPSNDKTLNEIVSSINQSLLKSVNHYANGGYNFNSNAIHNLNKERSSATDNKPVEVYDDDDFDFGDMDGQALKIDEKLLNPNINTSSKRNSGNFQNNSNLVLSFNFSNSNSNDNSNQNSISNSKNNIEEYGDEDFDFGDMEGQELKIDERLISNTHTNPTYLNPNHLLNLKGKSDSNSSKSDKSATNDKKKKLPYNTISLTSYKNYFPESDKHDKRKSMNFDNYTDDFDFDDFDSQELKSSDKQQQQQQPPAVINKIGTGTVRGKTKGTIYGTVHGNSTRPVISHQDQDEKESSKIEVYDDDDFDFGDLDSKGGQLKIDEKLLNPKNKNFPTFNPKKMLDFSKTLNNSAINNKAQASSDIKHSTLNSKPTNGGKPYTTISLNSFRNYISKNGKLNKDLDKILNNDYENILATKTKVPSDDSFSLSSESTNNLLINDVKVVKEKSENSLSTKTKKRKNRISTNSSLLSNFNNITNMNETINSKANKMDTNDNKESRVASSEKEKTIIYKKKERRYSRNIKNIFTPPPEKEESSTNIKTNIDSYINDDSKINEIIEDTIDNIDDTNNTSNHNEENDNSNDRILDKLNDTDEKHSIDNDVNMDDENKNDEKSREYRCDSLKEVIFNKFFGVEPLPSSGNDDGRVHDEAYKCLLDDLTDIISKESKSSTGKNSSLESTEKLKRVIEDINQKGQEMSFITDNNKDDDMEMDDVIENEINSKVDNKFNNNVNKTINQKFDDEIDDGFNDGFDDGFDDEFEEKMESKPLNKMNIHNIQNRSDKEGELKKSLLSLDSNSEYDSELNSDSETESDSNSDLDAIIEKIDKTNSKNSKKLGNYSAESSDYNSSSENTESVGHSKKNLKKKKHFIKLFDNNYKDDIKNNKNNDEVYNKSTRLQRKQMMASNEELFSRQQQQQHSSPFKTTVINQSVQKELDFIEQKEKDLKNKKKNRKRNRTISNAADRDKIDLSFDNSITFDNSNKITLNKKEIYDSIDLSKPQISSDGSLIPNTFSDIFKQRISIPAVYDDSSDQDQYQNPNKKSNNSNGNSIAPQIYEKDPLLITPSYNKLLNRENLVLSNAMIKHINNFKLPVQNNIRNSIDNLFETLESQEILDKILNYDLFSIENNEDYPTSEKNEEDDDNNSSNSRLPTELSLINSEYDEETKFNINPEDSLDSININRSHISNSSNEPNSFDQDRVKQAFKYIDAIRKSNINSNSSPSKINNILFNRPSRKSLHQWQGYDKLATNKRNHLYFTIMDIINDIKTDIFCNPWHELNEKLNLAIVENLKWEESIQEFQKHWKSERQSFPSLQRELEKWSKEYKEQTEIIDQYNDVLIQLNDRIHKKQKRQRQLVLFIFGMLLAEIFILSYIRLFVFTDELPKGMKKNGFWLPYLNNVAQKIFQRFF